MNCPNCGNQLPDRAKFCSNCGTRLDAVCPSCGEPCSPGAKFCIICGTPLGGSAPAAPVTAPKPAASNNVVWTEESLATNGFERSKYTGYEADGYKLYCSKPKALVIKNGAQIILNSNPDNTEATELLVKNYSGRKYLILLYDWFYDVYKVSSTSTATYLCRVNAYSEDDFDPIEWRGNLLIACKDTLEDCVRIFDCDFVEKFKLTNAKSAQLFFDEDTLYCSYIMSDNITNWFCVYNFNTDKVVAKIETSSYYNDIHTAENINGNLIFGSEDGRVYNTFYSTTAKIEIGDLFSIYYQKMKELSRLPKTSLVLLINQQGTGKDLGVADLITGTFERMDEKELKSRYG